MKKRTFNTMIFVIELFRIYITHKFHLVHVGFSQYTIHATRIQGSPSGYPICVKRAEDQIREDIITLGDEDVKFLFSPGAEKATPEK